MNTELGTHVVTRRRLVVSFASVGAAVLVAACTSSPASSPTAAPSTGAQPATAAGPTSAPAAAPTAPAAAAPTTAPATIAQAASAATPAPTAAAQLAGGKNVEIPIWAQVSPGEKARAAYFTKLHPNIKTTVSEQGTSGQGVEAVQKFLTAIAAGTAGSVVMFDRFQIAGYAYRHAFTALDDLIKRDNYDLKRFADACITECYGIDKKIYGLPRHVVDRYYMLNADHFKEVGLDPEAPLTDWNYFKEAGAKLTKKDSSGRITRVGIEPTIDMAYTWGWSNGGDWVTDGGRKATMNDPRNVEAFTFAATVADAMGGQEAISSFASSFQSAAGDPFLAGQSSMKFNGNTFLRTLAQYKPSLNFRGTYYATKDSTIPKQTWAAGHSWVIPRGAKETDIAWEIVKSYMEWDSFVVYEDALKTISDQQHTAYIPELSGQPSIDQKLAEKYKSNVEWIDKAFAFGMDILVKSPVVHVRPISPAAAEMWDAVGVALDETTRKKKTASQALKDANDKIQKVLDDAWATVSG